MHSSNGNETDTASDRSGRKSRRLLWLLGIGTAIPLAGVAVIVGLNIYNAQFRLTRERLDAAWQRWQQAAIDDYDITVRVRGSTQGVYQLEVRDGKVRKAWRNGQPFPSLRQAYPWTVEGLFTVVLEGDLERDQGSGTRPFTKVTFDAEDGHPIRYVRDSDQQRIVIEVNLTRR